MDNKVATDVYETRDNSPIITLRSLSKVYNLKSKKIYALRDVSLTISRGEFVAIMGKSGSGKSTLLQIIGGLESPSNGSVRVNGIDIGTLSERKRTLFRQLNIGFVFQFFYLQPFLSLRQNIELPQAFVSNTSQNKNTEHIDKLAASLSISDRLDHLPSELSGGQIQRASIARALANKPEILLADEPTGNLDQSSSENIIELFNKMRRQFGTTVVMVTHDKNIASRADRVITLKKGEIV